MAGPEDAAAQQAAQARVAEENDMKQRGGSGRVRRPRDTDKAGNFDEQVSARRQAKSTYKDRHKNYKTLIERLRERDRYARDLQRAQTILTEGIDKRASWGVVVDGTRHEDMFTYEEFFDEIMDRVPDEDKDYLLSARQSLDRHPEAIFYAESAGFDFFNEDDDETDVAEKAAKMRFLNNTIRSYNDGSYEPYYERQAAYMTMLEHDDLDYVWNGEFEDGLNLGSKSKSFRNLAKQYGVSTKKLEKWYEQADRVILAYERERLLDPEKVFIDVDKKTEEIKSIHIRNEMIDVDYSSLLDFSKFTTKAQFLMNRKAQFSVDPDGNVHKGSAGKFENVFNAIRDSSFKYYEEKDAKRSMSYAAQKFDECNAEVETLRKERTGYSESLDKAYEEPFSIGGGLQAMYDAEMDRYRNGFVQQAPMMMDMVKRWSREKTRFFDSRHEAKEQMREQKWSQKTGINERGIKTDSFFDFFKSLVNECRRSLAVSGVTDFSLIGDTDRLLVALGIDAAQNSAGHIRYKIEEKRNRRENEKIYKAMKRGEGDYEEMFGDFDTANYTRALQTVAEAESGTRYNGPEEAAADYDGRDNNPADVMAGRDDNNEKFKDAEQQRRNLQNLLDDKGYNTDSDDLEKDEPDGPEVD